MTVPGWVGEITDPGCVGEVKELWELVLELNVCLICDSEEELKEGFLTGDS